MLPLSGVTVLDLSRILAGPWATQMLADFGADVIKVERPVSGDDTRHWGPPFITQTDGSRGDAAYFQAANRNKRSVTIDFTQSEGANIIHQFAGKADVMVENFKLGGLKKYGLDYDTLRRINPKLVYCSITGFGQTGPHAARAGYDYLIQAMGGLMSITGLPDDAPGAEPMKVGVAVADLFTGLYASNAIMAALFHARSTGVGQHLDISLHDCQTAMLANQATNFLFSGKAPGRLGNAHPNIVPYQVFKTCDGYFVLAVGNDGQFRAFCEVAGVPALADDPDYTTNAARVTNREALVANLKPILQEKTTSVWISLLEAAGVPCGPIRPVDQVLSDDQCIARDMVVTMPDHEGVERQYLNNPVKMSETPVRNVSAPPSLGQHTEEVLKEVLGLDITRLAALKESKVI